MKSCINGATTMNYPLEEDFRSAAKAGFEGVEIWASKMEKYLQRHSVEDLKEELERYGLKAASLCPCWLVAFGEKREENLRRVSEAAQIAARIGCPTLLVCPDSPPADMPEDEAFRKAGEAARELGNICAEFGIRIAVEPLGMHPFVPGPEQALRIVDEAGTENVGIMMDTFHYYKSGVPLEAIASIPIDKLLIVHVNDCEDLPKEQLKDSHRLYPGLGVIPLEDMLGVIKANGYKGYFSVEIFREEYWRDDPDTISINSKRHLDSVLASLA